jgi:hypothetical protein
MFTVQTLLTVFKEYGTHSVVGSDMRNTSYIFVSDQNYL